MSRVDGNAGKVQSYLARTFPMARLVRVGIAIIAAVVGFGILLAFGQLGYYNLDYATDILPILFLGVEVTLRFLAFILPFGFGLGFLMGWARTSRSSTLRGGAAVYVEFFRGIPPLVLIFFSALIVGLIARQVFFVEDPSAYAIAAGAVALGVHSSAYQAEIIRAGILSVPTGQLEASHALGLTQGQTIVRVTLPQAFRVSLPALGNEFASVIKDTSLLSVISALELMSRGLLFVPRTIFLDFNLVFIIFTEVALLYFVITFAVTRTMRAVENAFKVPGLEAAQL